MAFRGRGADRAYTAVWFLLYFMDAGQPEAAGSQPAGDPTHAVLTWPLFQESWDREGLQRTLGAGQLPRKALDVCRAEAFLSGGRQS